MKNGLSLVWLLFTAICVIIILVGVKAALKRTNWDMNKQNRLIAGTAVIILAWIVMLLLFSYQGYFRDFRQFPPKILLTMLLPIPVIMIVAFSKPGTQLIKSVPPHWLVFIQSFRIVVELLLFMAFANGKIPVQMTFEGRNPDILTGILALLVGYFLLKRKTYATKLAIAFNIIGVLLLINILVVAVLSMPTPIRYFMNEPANTLVAEFPFILLPGVLVPIAYSMHILSLRNLPGKERTKSIKIEHLKRRDQLIIQDFEKI